MSQPLNNINLGDKAHDDVAASSQNEKRLTMNDISIDIETLSTRHDAAILAIGAAAFNRHTGEIGETFYAEINLDSAIESGHVSGSTLTWWLNQSARAKELFADDQDKVSINEALIALIEYIGPNAPCVWGNGATFDISILEQAFAKAFGGTPSAPWEYWDVRDMRTLVDAASTLGFDKRSMPFDGTEHNALDDAVHQAHVISACWNAVTRPPTVEATFTAPLSTVGTPLGVSRYKLADGTEGGSYPASQWDHERRLRAISTAVTGKADSSEVEVMSCIDKLTEYFTGGECARIAEGTIAWALVTPTGNIRFWSRSRAAVELQHIACPNEVLAPILGVDSRSAAAPIDQFDQHFKATRLRNVVKLVGLESAVPEDDNILLGAMGAVLGQIAAKLRERAAPDLSARDAADYIDRKAQQYINESASTEHDTGAVVFHAGEAGRDYHSTLVELAAEIRALIARLDGREAIDAAMKYEREAS